MRWFYLFFDRYDSYGVTVDLTFGENSEGIIYYMRFNHVLAMLIGCISAPGYATLFPHAEKRSGGAALYTVTIDKSSGGNTAPNPLLGGARGSMVRAVLAYEKPDGQTFYAAYNQCFISSNDYLQVTDFRTAGEVERFWDQANKHGLPCKGTTSVAFKGSTGMRACVMYRFPNSTVYTMWPGSYCDSYPPEDNNCWVSPASIQLDHGSIGSDSIEGATQSVSISVYCEKTLSVKLSMPDSGKIKLNSSGITSQIYINDSKGGGRVTGTPGGNNVSIKSVLSSAEAAKPGVYSNSSVIILSYE